MQFHRTLNSNKRIYTDTISIPNQTDCLFSTQYLIHISFPFSCLIFRMEYAPDIPNFIRIYDSCQKNNRKYGSSRISGCLYQLILIFILMPEFLSRKQRFFHIFSLRKTVPGNVLLQELLLPVLCPFPLKYL